MEMASFSLADKFAEIHSTASIPSRDYEPNIIQCSHFFYQKKPFGHGHLNNQIQIRLLAGNNSRLVWKLELVIQFQSSVQIKQVLSSLFSSVTEKKNELVN